MTNTPTPDPAAPDEVACRRGGEFASEHGLYNRLWDLAKAVKAAGGGVATIYGGLEEAIGIALSASRTAADDGRAVEVRPQWRHKKRGTTYVEVGDAQVQCSDSSLTDYEVVKVYRSLDGDDVGELWVRRVSEFNDGRFEPLTAPVQPRQEIAPAGQVTDEIVERACQAYRKAASDNFIPYSWMMRAALEAVWPTHQPDSTAPDGALLELALSIRARAAGITMAGLPATADGLVADVEKLEALLSHPEPPAVAPNERVVILEEAAKVAEPSRASERARGRLASRFRHHGGGDDA